MVYVGYFVDSFYHGEGFTTNFNEKPFFKCIFIKHEPKGEGYHKINEQEIDEGIFISITIGEESTIALHGPGRRKFLNDGKLCTYEGKFKHNLFHG